ncbi:hypothetical protein Ae406Ps2_1826c [Pseudonocardia sp. Ae406_Ps2]|uniref:hypothetical protein n=1 Tax=unclassified Pseudonocardia TaxID=2619320 RepID=UPI00094AE9D6|nr:MULTISPECIES: hypothetical protein [unclassified Pseudonocardia]OLM01826.1 hypothetical protein Ae406Ps2_1826c [Pseudonocardia sp. Ae406_Ps2]OLM06392.1 hypothetical protein Ae331Ps2_4102 [Pseudonocardia sp. Ae331_Ps2]OLM13126.1 hypothetical protein Ae505Ps2_3254 [Pseudonocardia sp. Ae505_Ps2]OLM23397.1 hypothetical protein Ae706Ps2_1830c [Pseudonocardia sp. Ae706_Ps2]OLM32452.1 hypothetical protein Ae717Ps2_3347c [Pseudonocardia sp. Ae717_Ps2]
MSGRGTQGGTQGGTHCGTHGAIPEDLRVTAVALLDRLRTATEAMSDSLQATGVDPGPGAAGSCTACPVCALIAVVRGERSELVTRLADHATGLLAVLVALLEEAAPPARRESRRPQGSGRSVQRIVVHRT